MGRGHSVREVTQCQWKHDQICTVVTLCVCILRWFRIRGSGFKWKCFMPLRRKSRASYIFLTSDQREQALKEYYGWRVINHQSMINQSSIINWLSSAKWRFSIAELALFSSFSFYDFFYELWIINFFNFSQIVKKKFALMRMFDIHK